MAINPTPSFPNALPDLNTSAVVQAATDPGIAVGTAPEGSPPGDSNQQAAEIVAIATELGVGDSPDPGTVRARLIDVESTSDRSSIVAVNGATGGYRADGAGGAYQGFNRGGTDGYLVVRKKHVVLEEGWFEGFEFYNGSGTISAPYKGEAPMANAVGFYSACCFESDLNAGYPMFNDQGRRDLVLDPGGRGLVRPNGGRRYVYPGDVIWESTVVYSTSSVDATAAAQLYPVSNFYDPYNGETVASGTITNLATGKARVDTFPWTVSNQALTPPLTFNLRVPGASRVLITPTTKGPAWAICGTSRRDGTTNPFLSPVLQDDGSYGRVFAARGIPYVRLSKGTSQIAIDTAKSAFVTRNAFMRGCTHVLAPDPQNDFGNGSTFAQVLVYLKAFLAPLRAQGMVTVGQTCDGWTTSSNRWIDLAGQTVANSPSTYEANRALYNAFVRDQLSPAQVSAAGGDPTITRASLFDYVYDAAGNSEEGTTGKYKAAATLYSGTATSATTAYIEDTGASFALGLNGQLVRLNVASVISYATVVNNTSTRLYLSQITGLENGVPYKATVLGAAPTGAVYDVFDVLTLDGLHRNSKGRAVEAAAFTTFLAGLGQ